MSTSELQYEPHPSGVAYYYWPAGPFVVDGISYNFADRDEYAPPMLETVRDHHCCRMGDICHNEVVGTALSHPPTEEELDRFVRTGALPKRMLAELPRVD